MCRLIVGSKVNVKATLGFCFLNGCFLICRLIVGSNVNMKAALGMPNVALHADAMSPQNYSFRVT